MDIKKQRGQFFTTKDRVLNVLVSLVKNDGDIFEPSAGSGHIINALEKINKTKIYSCELDSSKVSKKVCNSGIDIDNFFNYIKKDKKYLTSIGNPPFVKLKNVEEDTINILPEKINDNGNLYYYFIKYSDFNITCPFLVVSIFYLLRMDSLKINIPNYFFSKK